MLQTWWWGWVGGELDGESFCQAINSAYDEAVTWRRNLSLVPTGKIRSSFMTPWQIFFVTTVRPSTMKLNAPKAAMVMPILLLLKPHAQSRTWDHVQSLKRQMILWEMGNIDTLVQKCRMIQGQLRTGQSYGNSNDNKQCTTHVFVRLMLQGKVKAALRVLDTQGKSGVLPLNRTVPSSGAQPGAQQTIHDILIQKHPPGQPTYPETLLQCSPV